MRLNIYRWFAIASTIAVGIMPVTAYSTEGISKLTLDESLAVALKNSVALHAAQEGIREAEAHKNEAFSAFLPRLSTSYGYTRVNPTPYMNLTGNPPLTSPYTITIGTNNNYTWALELRQTLFAGGGIMAGYEIGRLGRDVARLAESMVEADLIRDVTAAYFRILKAERMLGVARQTVESLGSHRDQARLFHEQGIIPRNDLLSAEVELANGKQRLLRAQNGLEMEKSTFNTLLRRDIASSVGVEDVLAYHPFDSTWEVCLATGLGNRLELKASTLQVDQAAHMVKQAQSEYFPTVNVMGNYSRFGDTSDVSGSTYKGQENWYVTIMANWNIWEGGRTKNRVEATTSKAQQTIDASLAMRDRITLELKNAYLLVKEAEQQIPSAKLAVDQAEENLRIARERYHEHVSPAMEVIDAQTILTRAQSDYYNALGDYHINLAGLVWAMGVKSFPVDGRQDSACEQGEGQTGACTAGEETSLNPGGLYFK